MKRFRVSLVVGKFSPLHLGHEQVIRRAIDESDEVLLLSYSKPEFPRCDAQTRERWLKIRFPTARVLVVSDAWLVRHPEIALRWPTVPENDAPAEFHRAFCADLCSIALDLHVNAVYSSEDYGEGFSEFLTDYYRKQNRGHERVVSVVVDRERVQHAISGTALRSDPALLQKWTAPEVYASFIRRICFLGGESSGKSTLAEALARKYETHFVPEYGRELWEKKSGALVYSDLVEIARVQIAREEDLTRTARGLLFCDTSPLTTLYYSVDLFGKADPELASMAQRRYDLVVLCAPDFPFFQDGTRRDTAFREAQHAWYLEQLEARAIPFHIVHGGVLERVDAVTELVSGL